MIWHHTVGCFNRICHTVPFQGGYQPGASFGGVLWEIILAIGGALIGALIAIWRENSAKPNLVISIGSNTDATLFGLGEIRFTHLQVKNTRWPKLWQHFWYGKRPALFCKAKMEFINPETQDILFAFAGRWSSTPEPLIRITTDSAAFDPVRAMSGEVEMLMPDGEEKELDVAIKINGNNEFIGFNNWSYTYPTYKNPKWVSASPRILLRVTLSWDSGILSKEFIVENNGTTPQDLHLIDIQS